MKICLLRLSALMALACGLAIPVAYAQSGAKEVSGAVHDVLGHPLPDATAALKDASGNAVVITADRLDRARNGIQVETGSSIYRIGRKEIAAMPQGEDTAFNEVLLRVPGVAQDSFGQLHVRGDHANLQYRLNGIILPESISGFGQTLDTRFVDSVSILTGALPAQYGYRTAGVVDIHTKTGELADGGNIGVQIGSNNTRQVSGDVSGSTDTFSYYINGSFDANNLGIENPTAASSALHDRALQNKAFGYFSYLLDPDTRVSLILGNSDGRFQIPNSAGQTAKYQLDGVTDYPSANLDERQRETNRYGILALQGKIGSDIDYQVAAFSRYSKVLFEPDQVGDLLYTGVASRVLRSGLANGLQADGSYRLNASHILRAGINYTRENLKNSDNSLTFPADESGNQLSTQAIALADSSRKITNETGLYLQDEWTLSDKVTVNYGARADWVHAYVSASQFSPRIGVVYQMTPQTTFHAGYAKYFTPPASELIGSNTIASFNGTTNASPSLQNDPVQAESSDYFDLGVNHQLMQHLTLGLDGYYKNLS